MTCSTSAIPVPLPALCKVVKFIFSRPAPARFVPVGIGVIRDPVGGFSCGGGALVQTASQWFRRNGICACLQCPPRAMRPLGARPPSQATTRRVANPNLVYLSATAAPETVARIETGLVLLGNRVDKGRSESLTSIFTVGDNAAFKTSSPSGADQSSGSSHENEGVFMSSRVQMPAAGWKIISSFFVHFTLAVSPSFRHA